MRFTSRPKDNTEKKEKKGKKQIKLLPLYFLLVIVFVLYLVYQRVQLAATILGIILLLTIIAVITLEIINGIKEYGYSKNVIELIIVVLVVFGVWLGLRFILNTSYPLDVVPSCSMLPVLQRGNMLVLQGVNGINGIKAPVINITQSDYNQIVTNPTHQFLSCIAYLQNGNNLAKISQYLQPGYQIGLYAINAYGGSIVSDSYQSNNTVRFVCGTTPDKLANGSIAKIVTTNAIIIKNTVISGARNNTIVVYSTTPQDLFYQEGDSYIVHRVYAVLNVSGKYYFLTKGDNNPGLDLQYGNYPVNSSRIEGKMIASIPYVGYLKLILSNQFNEPAGCNSTISNS